MTDEAFANICFCVINKKYFEFIYIFIKLRKIIKKKKNMKAKFSMIGVLLISLFTVVNIVKSNQKNKRIEDIMLGNVESLAFPESGIGSDMRIATKHVCYLNNEVFDESTGRLEHIPVEGRIGICDGTEGACKSWPCTEVWL